MRNLSPKIIKPARRDNLIPRSPVKYVWFVSKPHKKYVVAALFAATAAQILGTSTPFIMRSIIDSANKVMTHEATITNVWFWAVLAPIVGLSAGLLWRLSAFTGMRWITGAGATSYTTLFKYLSGHGHAYFTDRFAGSLSSKITHASEGAQATVEAFLWNYYPLIISFITTIFYLVNLNGSIAIIFLTLVVILFPVNIYASRRRRPYVLEYSEQHTSALGYAVDSITNISAIRQYTQAEKECRRFSSEIALMRLLNMKHWRSSEWSLVFNNVIILFFEAAILFYSLYEWSHGKISIGGFVMVVMLLIYIEASLIHIGSSLNSFTWHVGGIEEGLKDILTEYEVVDTPEAKKLLTPKGEIVWNNVTFKFGNNLVFNNFNLTIKAGEHIGLVGSSGAGKSTFVSLLLRERDLDKGTIFIDEQNIKDVTQDSLREHIAVVPQEPILFHRSVKENILYGKPSATQKEIVDVAKKAQAHDFITSLPDGYNTLVGERGIKLSGGQKQRIAIARAMLKDAPILLLDEATSALDSESEIEVQKALHELMVGKTVVATAHRLSTLREMDKIIVLEKGEIVEKGTHTELIKREGVYARLWKHQTGRFLKRV